MTGQREHANELLLLTLSQLPGIGPTRINDLIKGFGGDPNLLDASPERFMQVPGIGDTLAHQMAKNLGDRHWRQEARVAAEKQLDLLDKISGSIVTILDPSYPRLLSEIYDPPPVLFVRGDPESLSLPSIAVVGTRKATSYGKQATELFCRELVQNGFGIASGLAYGIDMTAHRTALDQGGVTIAVLGCGVDTIYTDPAGRVWPKILERGAIISEEWIGTEPLPGNFPKRNRLISGLASGTLVVESDIRGGSLITASCAIEQNREVFAVPGSIFSRASRGTNLLIQQCHAKPVLTSADILMELSCAPSAATAKQYRQSTISANLTNLQALIVETLDQEPLHIDMMAEKTGIALETLLVELFELELNRVIVQEPGRIFRKRT
jgi:DNA processing protein